MRKLAAVLVVGTWGGAAWSQSADAPLNFEVASIKQSPPPDGRGMRVGCNGGPGAGDPSRITCTNINLSNLVTSAYGIAHYQLIGLSGGDPERFEITVKVPEGATRDQVKLMWQNLLADRFKLAVHREQREMPRYELTVAKGGPKMQVAAEAPPPNPDRPPPPRPDTGPRKPLSLGSDGFPELGPGMSMAMMANKARWRAEKLPASGIASMLGAQLGQPVTDVTGLTAKYDFVLSWVTGSRPGRGAAVEGGSPLAGLGEGERVLRSSRPFRASSASNWNRKRARSKCSLWTTSTRSRRKIKPRCA